MSEKIENQRAFLKATLSELYHELSNDSYGNRYAGFKNIIIDDYKRLENGANCTQITQKLLTQLDDEVLRNLHLQQKNPEVMHQAIKKLKEAGYKNGADQVFSNYGMMFPFK